MKIKSTGGTNYCPPLFMNPSGYKICISIYPDLIVHPSKSCNRILCISYNYLIPWFTIGRGLFGSRPCTDIPAAHSCSWQAGLDCCTCPLQSFPLLHPLGGTLSPLVGSTSLGLDHICWPTNYGYSTGSTFVVEVWVGGRKAGMSIIPTSFLPELL